MEIETKLGTLKTRLINSKHYPGISFGLKTANDFIEFGFIEVDQNPYDEPTLKVHIYNTTDEEPVFDLVQTAEDISNYFGEG